MASTGEAKADEKKPVVDEPAELSEEDLQLKTELEECVKQLSKPDQNGSHLEALTKMRESIRAATNTMTSVPKPLKFLRAHYDELKAVYAALADGPNKAFTADVLSLLAMTNENGDRECLAFRFVGSQPAVDHWGHEYVRHLAGELAEEYQARSEADPPRATADLLALANAIIPYYMTHNAEADACDLAMEVEQLGLCVEHVDAKAYARVCQYLLACVPYVAEPDDAALLRTALAIFRKFAQWPSAMLAALRLGDSAGVAELFGAVPDAAARRQVAFLLARQQVWLDPDTAFAHVGADEAELLTSIMSNARLSQHFLALGRELDILEPKTPEDIYKTHLDGGSGAGGRLGAGAGAAPDSALGNLAATFVNAFVNAGFGRDKLVLAGGDGAAGSKWVYRHKERGLLSATAALGLLLRWDVAGGLTQIDTYLLAADDNVKAGALLALGLVSAGVRDENEPALALLQEYVLSPTQVFRVGAGMGLGLAYAGSAHAAVGELLLPVLDDPASTLEARGAAALALGQVFVGTCDGAVTEALVQCIMQRTPAELASPHARLLALALGLVHLGKQQAADVALATLACVEGSFGRLAAVLVEACAYAGTGNVLRAQRMLHYCSEHVDPAAEGFTPGDDAFQAFAVLGLALVAMGEEIGIEMALRSCNHLLQYGEPVIRRAVPLALALLCASNPRLHVLDVLGKLSHDPDAATAHAAILALGVVGAGTNHARIGGMLRTLAQYYHSSANAVFVVRLAQGLLHTGKGSITLAPFHTDRTLWSPVAVAGLLGTLVAAVDLEAMLLQANHFMLYHLALAMYPRILSTLDADLNPISTLVRVGNAVDTVGQAGNPKTITGFVTNSTPVLLGFGERAQLATDEYLPQTPILEGFVLLSKNPEYEQHH